jgi:mannose/fructose/N-acetylgalactosamine-specific phosphotransferase system component IIC
MTEWLLLGLAVSLINATCIRWGIFFLGEPLVLGAGLGLYLGDLGLGLYLGGILQFMWMKSIPVGVKVQSNFTIMTFLTIMLVHDYGERAYPLAFAAAYLFAFLGKQAEGLLRRFDNVIADRVMTGISRINLTAVNAVYLAGYVAVFFVIILAGLVVSGPLMDLGLRHLPARLFDAFGFSYPYLVLYALSLFLQAVSLKGKLLYLSLGIAAGLGLLAFNFSMVWNILVLIVLAGGLALVNGRLLGFTGRKNAA